MDICVWFVSADVYIFRIFSAAEFCHYVLWKVDKDRSRTAGAGNVEGFFDNSAKVFTSADSNAVFGDASGDSYDVYFLECIVADEVAGYLAGEAYKRYAVIVGGCKSCYKVGCSGTAGYQTYADFAGGSGVGVGFVDKGLFVTGEDDFDIVLFVEFITDVDGTGSGGSRRGILRLLLLRLLLRVCCRIFVSYLGKPPLGMWMGTLGNLFVFGCGFGV